MIYDSQKRLVSYRGLTANLDWALTYLEEKGTSLSSLPEGRHPVQGDTVIVQVMGYETKDLSVARYEAHRKYIDIQLVLEGKEGCYVRPLAELEPAEPFNEEKDIGFYKGEGGSFLPLYPGVFAIFFPWDAHKPSCDWEGKHQVRKIVVKVKV